MVVYFCLDSSCCQYCNPSPRVPPEPVDQFCLDMAQWVHVEEEAMGWIPFPNPFNRPGAEMVCIVTALRHGSELISESSIHG